MFPTLGGFELLVIAGLAIVLFGDKLVGKVAKSLGKTKAAAENAQKEMDAAYAKEKEKEAVNTVVG